MVIVNVKKVLLIIKILIFVNPVIIFKVSVLLNVQLEQIIINNNVLINN